MGEGWQPCPPLGASGTDETAGLNGLDNGLLSLFNEGLTTPVVSIFVIFVRIPADVLSKKLAGSTEFVHDLIWFSWANLLDCAYEPIAFRPQQTRTRLW